MSDENENTPTPEDDQPESSADSGSDEQPVEPQDDAPAEDAPSEAAAEDESEPESEPEASEDEAAALAAAMAAVNQLQGVADSASEPAAAAEASDPVAEAMAQAAAESAAEAFESPVLENKPGSNSKQGMDLLSDVHMNVRIELGRTKMFVEDVLKLGQGAVVELDKLAGDPVDVFVNDRKVARGEVLVLNDLFCVRISEIVDISSTDA
jgi:flagellar motor switch protein FliN